MTPVLYYFIKSIQKVDLPFIFDTFLIHEFISIYFSDKKDSINSFEILKENINGYLLFDIQKSNIKKRLAKYKEGKTEYYITGGIYISLFAQSLINDNSSEIGGFLLDTTWKCLPYYVTSILMVSIKNTGIPVSFSFGHRENTQLYERHFPMFESKLGIHLEKYIFESDQETSLKSIFESKKN